MSSVRPGESADYRPKNVRAGNGEYDAPRYAELPEPTPPGVNLNKLADAIESNPIDEIRALLRSLTYGEMIEFADMTWNASSDGVITRDSLPTILHRMATGSQNAKDASQKDRPANSGPFGDRRSEAVDRRPQEADAAQDKPFGEEGSR